MESRLENRVFILPQIELLTIGRLVVAPELGGVVALDPPGELEQDLVQTGDVLIGELGGSKSTLAKEVKNT